MIHWAAAGICNVTAIVRRVLICGVLLLPAPLASAAEPFPHYDTFLRGAVWVDDHGLGGGGSAVLPLWYDQSNLLFADLRGGSGAHESVDANFGVGFRHLTAADWIVGAYGFYDRAHLDSDTAINQGVLGVELMNVDWSLRVNGYLPESFERYAGIVWSDTHNEPANLPPPWDGDHVIRVTRETIHAVEGVYAGADFELGYLLREWNAGDIELRGFVGGFYFDRNGNTYESNYEGMILPPGFNPERHQSRYEAITGPRLRAELRVYDLPALGPQSRLVATGQYQWDEVRGSQGLVSIGFRVAFGDRSSPKLSRIRRRMLDTIPRQSAVIERGRWRETKSFTFIRPINAAEIEPPTITITLRPTDPSLTQPRKAN